MSFLENALQSFNAAAAAAQASTATAIDEDKTVLQAQSKNAAVEQEDTRSIDNTMALHHFAPKIVDFLDKYIDSDFGINDVVKRPAEARENMGDDADDPDAGTELQTIETQPPPPETPATVPEESAAVDPPVTTVDPSPADVIPDAAVDTLAPGFSVLADVGAVPSTDVVGQKLLDDLGGHFRASGEDELAGKIEGGTAEPGEIINKLNTQNDNLFDTGQPTGTSTNAQDLLRRTNEYQTRSGETTQEPVGGDPVAPPPPAPTAGAGEAAAADAEAAQAAAASAESEEALALL